MATRKRRIRLRQIVINDSIEIPPQGEVTVIELDLEPGEYVAALVLPILTGNAPRFILARDVTPDDT